MCFVQVGSFQMRTVEGCKPQTSTVEIEPPTIYPLPVRSQLFSLRRPITVRTAAISVAGSSISPCLMAETLKSSNLLHRLASFVSTGSFPNECCQIFHHHPVVVRTFL